MTTSAYASYDLGTLTIAYDGRLVGDPQIVRRLVDTQWGVIEVQDVTLELACVPGVAIDPVSTQLLAAYLADPKRFRGRSLVIKRHDKDTGYLATEWTGKVARCSRTRTKLVIEGSNFDRAILDRPLPEPIVETSEFPNAVDVGVTIPVVFGTVPRVPLPYVNDDVVGSHFDRLVAWGEGTVTGAYRNGPNDTLYQIDFSEFEKTGGGAATSWAEVARYDLAPGKTMVRTLLRQTDFNNAHHKLFADVTFPDRNFARLARRMLKDASWGLEQTMDATSWDEAERQLAMLAGDIYLDVASVLPVLYWGMNDLTSPVADFSGNGRTGTINGAVTVNVPGAPIPGTAGGVNTAMSFPGATTAFLNRAADAGLNSATQGTVTAWVKPALLHPVTNGGGIVEKTVGGAANTQFSMFQTADDGYPAVGLAPGIRFRVLRSSVLYDAVCPLTATDVGQWHWIVGTYNNGALRIYKNGALVGVTSYPAGNITTGSGEFLVGKLGTGVTYPFNGSLDEVAFYNFEFSAAQVALLYQNGGLLADGAMLETKPARQWLRECLIVRGMRLGINAAGAWTCTVDAQQNAIRLHIADDGRNTLLDTGAREPLAPEDLCRKRVVKYREDFQAGRMLFKARRTLNVGEGTNRTEVNHFLRDHAAADMVVDYLADLDRDAEEQVDVDLPQEARALAEGDLVQITDGLLGYSGDVMTPIAVSKELTRIRATLQPRYWGRDFYTPAALPSDNVTTSTGPPTTPAAGPTVTNPKPGSFYIVDGNPRATNVAEVVIYVNTVNNSATATELTRGRFRSWTDQTQAYASQRWYWLKHADALGTLSGFSPAGTSGAAGASTTTGSDIATGASGVATTNVVDSAISDADVATTASTAAVSSETVILTVTVPGTGGYCVIEGKVFVTLGNNFAAIVRVRKGTTTGGTQLDQSGGQITGITGAAPLTIVVMAKDSSPGTSQSYVLTLDNAGGSAVAGNNCILKAERFKK